MNLKNSLIIISLIVLVSNLKANAQLGFGFQNSQIISNESTLIQASQLRNEILFYDQEQNNLVLLRNVSFPANLRIVFMDPSFKIKKVIRPPETIFKRAFSIQGINFYPTKNSLSGKNSGLIIFETDKGFIIVDLVKMIANFIEFGSEFSEGPHDDATFNEIKSPSYLK